MLADDASEIGARIGVGFAFHGLGSLIGMCCYVSYA